MKPNKFFSTVCIVFSFFITAGCGAQVKNEQKNCVKNEQKDSVNQNNIICGESGEIQARFPGGQKALQQYLKENVNWSVVDESQTQGRVTVCFTVKVDGSLTDVTVIRGLNPKCDAEAVRVVKNMPKWIPATYLGEAVERKFYLPFSFFKKE